MADRISELPDLILHGILRRLPSQEQAAQTTAISRRWRNLWRSYTVVDFYYCRGNFHKFAEASIERFTRDSLLRMEFLRFWIAGGDEDNFARTWPLVEKLFVLALERKAEEIVIKIMRTYTGDYYYTPHFCLPYRSLSNSAVKILQLEGIKLRCGNDYNLLLPLHFLQSLHMYDVELDDERLLESLIASSPLLENLQLHAITNLNKIEVSNVANLRTLGIMYCDELTEIKIAAPLLHTLRLELISEKCKIELSTPQLHFLEMMDEFVLGASDFVAVLSKLQSVKSLILNGGFPQEDRMLRFSIPNLEELTLINPYGLSEIDIDTGLGLKKFSLKYEVSCPNELVKCNINHAACCLWELHIGSHVGTSLNNPQQWFVDLKNFMVRFPQFQTIYIIQSNFYMVRITLVNYFI
ncbi:Putative F-box/LRR-repeat protein At3g18150 [Linum perenne]